MNEKGLTAEQFTALIEADDDRAAELAAQYLATAREDAAAEAAPAGAGWFDIPDFLRDYREELHKAVCVDWDACAKLKYLDGSALQAGLEEAIGPVVRRWAGPVGWVGRRIVPVLIGLVAARMVTMGIQSWCDCP
jgi:hypothetical protein